MLLSLLNHLKITDAYKFMKAFGFFVFTKRNGQN